LIGQTVGQFDSGPLLLLGARDGRRRGELLALRWQDVQLLDGHVRVREAFVKGRFTTPKSKTSRRLIELGPRTKQLLAEHWQNTNYTDDDDLVFAHPQKGTPLDPSRLAREHWGWG
jgi:integrase